MLTVRGANKAEVNVLLDIYIEKVKWLRLQNKTLWDESQFTLEALTTKYEEPIFYIGYIDEEVIGGFILLEQDRIYWPDKVNGDAYYFHKFVIKNAYCGKGYSDRMINWVKRHGKENTKKYIRLDYDGNRKPIKELYTRNGFVPVETISNSNTSRLVKAEYLIS